MKSIKYIFISVLALVLISACDNYTGEKRIVTNSDFEIELPDWLEETNDLAPHAIYQFKSRYRNTYGIVVKSEKGNQTFEHYQQESIKVLRNFNELTNLLVTDSGFVNNTYTLELMGDIQAEKVFYWHNTYETAKNYYQLVLWTRSYDRKQKYSPAIEEVISSFKLK